MPPEFKEPIYYGPFVVTFSRDDGVFIQYNHPDGYRVDLVGADTFETDIARIYTWVDNDGHCQDDTNVYLEVVSLST